MKKVRTIPREVIEKTYRENSNIRACKILKISQSTLNKYLKLYNIPFKGQGRPVKYKIV